MVSKYRHNLSDESIRAGTVLQSWARVDGLLPETKLVKMFQDKSRRDKVIIVED